MEALIRSIGRTPQQRTTLYRPVPEERRAASFVAGRPRADRAHPAAQAGRGLAEMSSGRTADTVMFGTSTTWLMRRSTATLARR